MRKYFFAFIIFVCACNNKNSVDKKQTTGNDSTNITQNIFDTGDGSWVTYSGVLTGNNSNGARVKLTFFVSPYIGKMKFSMTKKSINKQKVGKHEEIKGSYKSFGRHVKKRYETVYEFTNEKNKSNSLFFIRPDDNTLIELNSNKKKYENGMLHTLKKEK